MRELILKRWCDACFAEGAFQSEAVHTYTLGIVAGEKTRPALKLLELCETHDKIAQDLQQLLAGIGQSPELPKAKPAPAPELPSVAHARRPITCPACQQDYARNTMVAHVWNAHRTDRRPDVGLVCPECREQVRSATGMAAHRRAAHDFDALAEALAGVDDRTWPAMKAWRAAGARL